MKKIRFFLNFKKEEEFLDKMAAKGFVLEKYTGISRYHFKEDKPRNLKYKVTFNDFLSKREEQEYINLFEAAGWSFVTRGRLSQNFYFVRDIDVEGEDLYPDGDFNEERYKKIRSGCLSLAIIVFCDCILNPELLSMKYSIFDWNEVWNWIDVLIRGLLLVSRVVSLSTLVALIYFTVYNHIMARKAKQENYI